VPEERPIRINTSWLPSPSGTCEYWSTGGNLYAAILLASRSRTRRSHSRFALSGESTAISDSAEKVSTDSASALAEGVAGAVTTGGEEAGVDSPACGLLQARELTNINPHAI
jgi:hypothetical protein